MPSAGMILVHVLLLAGVVVMITPFLYMISTSFKTMNDVFTVPVQWIPRTLEWHNFVDGWQAQPFGRYFFNSVFVATAVTMLNLITCSLAAYSFAKFRYVFRGLFFSLVLMTLMVPYVALIVPLFLVVRDLGWVNSYVGLIVPAGTSAFGIFLLRQHMLSIPDELLASARIDGASEPRIYWQVILPLSRNALSALAIFIFTWNWDSFLWPLLVVQSESLRTLPLGIASFNSSYSTNYPELMAVALLAMLPVLTLFLLMQRNFIEAMTLSGVKG
ncbi:MAG: putative transporter permease protein [Chloroflexi bacterium]|nr:putative transporter permease protein [Chloroflexota bacterium]